MRLLGLVLVTLVLSACASRIADPNLDAEAKLFRALADKACIYVVPSISDSSVAVSLDGRKVGTLGASNFLRLDVPPGRHVLSAAPGSLVPVFLRETPEIITLEAEEGHCYYLRALWRQDERSGRPFRVYLGRVTDAEGQREINIRTLLLPAK